jgi:hypothetical protein
MANKKELTKKKKKKELGGDVLKMSLLADDTYKKYKNIVKTIKDRIDIDEIDAEIMRLHSGRISRTLYGTTPGGDRIMSAALQDSSHRSRMAEIRVRITKQADLLNITLDATRIHLSKAFADEMSDIRTKAERMGYFDTHLTIGIILHAKLDSLITRIDTLIKDIDQTSYTIQHAVKILELVYHHSGSKQ